MTLTWEKIDLERGRATLDKTKNGERRALHLTHLALEVVRDMKEKAKSEGGLLFPSRKRPERPIELRKAWLDALARAGIADFRFHDLRHTAASYLAMNGATLAEIAEVLGHRTLNMVKRYAHMTETHVKGVIEKMNANIFTAVA